MFFGMTLAPHNLHPTSAETWSPQATIDFAADMSFVRIMLAQVCFHKIYAGTTALDVCPSGSQQIGCKHVSSAS